MIRNKKSTFRPTLEALEERAVPASIFNWNSSAMTANPANWSLGSNWLVGGVAPAAGPTALDSVIIDQPFTNHGYPSLSANSACATLSMPTTDGLILDLNGHTLTVGNNASGSTSSVLGNAIENLDHVNPANLNVDNGTFSYDYTRINGADTSSYGQMKVNVYDSASLTFGTDFGSHADGQAVDLYVGFTQADVASVGTVSFAASNTNTIHSTHSAATRVSSLGKLTYNADDTVTDIDLDSAGTLKVDDGCTLTSVLNIDFRVTGGTAFLGNTGTVTINGYWAQTGGTMRLGWTQAASYCTVSFNGTVALTNTIFEVDVSGVQNSVTSDKLVCNNLNLGGGGDTLSVHTYNYFGGGQSLKLIDTNNSRTGTFGANPNWNGGHAWTWNGWPTNDLVLT